MPRVPRILSNAVCMPLRSLSTSVGSTGESSAAAAADAAKRKRSFAIQFKPEEVVPEEKAKTVARAIGCSVDDLVAFPSLTDPENEEKVLVTAKSLTLPPPMRPPYLEWRTPVKPISLKTKRFNQAYKSPVGLNDAYKEALAVIEEDKEQHYAKALKLVDKVDKLKAQQEKATDEKVKKSIGAQIYIAELDIEKYRVLAEVCNTEAIVQFERGQADMRFAIHRELARKKWMGLRRIQLVDRLENMHVMPDTMPYLNPLVDLQVRFPGPTAYWFDPGRILSTGVTALEPEFKINTFSDETRLYTIVIVDPDTPDLENDSYKTTLHYILSDIEIHGNHPEVKKENARVVVPYLPPAPEKNSGIHRYSVWLFQQPDAKPLALKQRGDKTVDEAALLQRDRFDIRLFRSAYGLKSVGAHLWRNKYDTQTEAVRERFNLGPGTVWSRSRIIHYD